MLAMADYFGVTVLIILVAVVLFALWKSSR
jgi:hypothetical protein